MISLAAAILGLFVIFRIFAVKRATFVAGFAVLFSLSYRIVDSAYLDLAGPTWAIELDKFVGGNAGTPMFVASSMCFIVPLGWLCAPTRFLAQANGPVPDIPYLRILERGAFVGSSALLAFLYLDMLRIGVIPLLSGMDRQEYGEISGFLHNPAYSMNFLVSAILGMMTVLPRLRGGTLSLRFIGLFVILLLYWALTGNRASAFVICGTYFALPFAVPMAMTTTGHLPRQGQSDAWRALVSSRVIVPASVVVGLVVLISLLINSYYEVRDYADPLYQITQRVLVQPVQIWASTWGNVHFLGDLGPDRSVIDQVLIHPDDPTTNTSIRYLMSHELGYFRAAELNALGQQYAGGYPEIFFHLLGSWFALPMMALLGASTAGILRLTLSGLSRGKILTAIMGVYLFYGFTLAYVGGMLNFLIVWTFAAKAFAMVVASLFENGVLRASVAKPSVLGVPKPNPLLTERNAAGWLRPTALPARPPKSAVASGRVGPS